MRASLDVRSAIYSRADYVAVEQGAYFNIQRVGDASNEQRDRLTVSSASFRHPREPAGHIGVVAQLVAVQHHRFGDAIDEDERRARARERVGDRLFARVVERCVRRR